MSGSWPLERIPCGFRQLDVGETAVKLSGATGGIPKNGSRASITVEGNAIRWTDDGTVPTNSVGMLAAVGSTFILPSINSINQFQAIEAAGGDAGILDVSYYGDSNSN